MEIKLYLPMSHCGMSSPTAWTSYSLTHTFGMYLSETSMECWSDRCHGDDGGGSFPRTLECYWLSINSIVLMYLLVGFVATILIHVLRIWYNLDDTMTSGVSGDDWPG